MGKRLLTRRTGLVLFVAALAAAAMILGASLVTTKAEALPTFTNAVNGIGPCDSCHTKTSVHGNADHATALADCSNCHVGGDTSVPPTPAKCGVCHSGGSAILTSTSHTATGCGTTAGCHGVPDPTVTPKLTIKSAASVKVKKPITISGKVTPTSLAGRKVSVTIQKKSGAKWKPAKSASATISVAGAYSYKYKPAAKGTYRAKGAMAAKAGVNTAAATAWKTFKVK